MTSFRMSRIDRAIRPRPDRRYPPFEPGDVKAPYTVIFRAVRIHPTIAEFLPTVLRGLRPLE